MYFLASVTSQVPRTWNLKYLKTGSILSLLIVSFGFLTSKNLPIPNFKMKGWLGQYLQQKTWIQNGGFYPGTPILFKFLNLDNFGTVLSWGLNFQGLIISTLSTNSEKMGKIWEVRVSLSKNIRWFDLELRTILRGTGNL